MSAGANFMTTQELLAIPDDDFDRELVRGQLRVRPKRLHTPRHAYAMARLASMLETWLCRQSRPRGEILAGEPGFQIRRDPDTVVGIDIAYISADLAQRTPDDAVFIKGVPTLALEILAPWDTHGEIVERIQEYLDAGMPLVWIVDPDLQTVTVHRPDEEPEFFAAMQVISDEEMLPGLRLPVASLFGF